MQSLKNLTKIVVIGVFLYLVFVFTGNKEFIHEVFILAWNNPFIVGVGAFYLLIIVIVPLLAGPAPEKSTEEEATYEGAITSENGLYTPKSEIYGRNWGYPQGDGYRAGPDVEAEEERNAASFDGFDTGYEPSGSDSSDYGDGPDGGD